MKNDIDLHGYLGRDPELSWVNGKNGQYAKVAFSVGVGRDYGDETDWFYCVMYGKRAEVIDKYFSKGSEILLSGRMESYKPKKDPDHTAWIVKVEGFDFVGKSNRSGSSNSSSGTRSEESKQMTYDDIPDSFEQADEDIPF